MFNSWEKYFWETIVYLVVCRGSCGSSCNTRSNQDQPLGLAWTSVFDIRKSKINIPLVKKFGIRKFGGLSRWTDVSIKIEFEVLLKYCMTHVNLTLPVIIRNENLKLISR
jgi:hypothetical protein